MHWRIALFVSSLASVSCASDDPTVERRGGASPTPTVDPIAMMPAVGGTSGGDTSDAGATAGGEISTGGSVGVPTPIAFCAALDVVRAKCQRCHQEPPTNGAPVAFVDFEDFQAPYGSSGMTYGEVATRAVELDIMPYVALSDPPTSLMPPVQPLTSDEKTTLLTWLKQGALPEGGTDCP